MRSHQRTNDYGLPRAWDLELLELSHKEMFVPCLTPLSVGTLALVQPAVRLRPYTTQLSPSDAVGLLVPDVWGHGPLYRFPLLSVSAFATTRLPVYSLSQRESRTFPENHWVPG